MFGGLTKTSSRIAIAAAFGMFGAYAMSTPANAADFGGDCCADLEERVAELAGNLQRLAQGADALEEQLATTRYALGDRPTAADTILLGGLRAHTNQDPIPDLSRFTRVLEWNAQPGADWKGDGELATNLPNPPAAHGSPGPGRWRAPGVLVGSVCYVSRLRQRRKNRAHGS